MGLGRVVGRPILWIGPLNGFLNRHPFRHRHAAIAVAFARYDVFGSKDVLALDATGFVIGTTAMLVMWVKADGVAALAGLGWHHPSVALSDDVGRGRCRPPLCTH